MTLTPDEKRQAEIEAWLIIYRNSVSQARTAAERLAQYGVKLSPPVIVKTNERLTKTEILIKI